MPTRRGPATIVGRRDNRPGPLGPLAGRRPPPHVRRADQQHACGHRHGVAGGIDEGLLCGFEQRLAAAHVARAERLDGPLVTCDGKLTAASGSRCPFDFDLIA
ncbi:hypothetical protein BH20ACT6_BH20ACT6_25050 [soil metagenome]